MKHFCSLILLFSLQAYSAPLKCPERISQVTVDRCKVNPVCFYPGRISLIEMPCKIEEVNVGGSDDVNVKITSAEQFYVWLREGTSQSTNIVVKCIDEPLPLVLDAIPSKKNNTSFIGFTGFSDSGECKKSGSRAHSGVKIIDSSEWVNKKPVVKRGQVIESSSWREKKKPTVKRGEIIDSSDGVHRK